MQHPPWQNECEYGLATTIGAQRWTWITSSKQSWMGLKGVVYTDDGLVMDLIVSKRSLDEEATLPATPDFVRAVAEGADFVHIVVDRSEAIEVFR